MKIRIINKDEFRTSKWSGGETTEFFIYPEDSSYVARNFMFRVSSAAVNLENTVFTGLEGFKRWLMVLEGNITLRHTDENKDYVLNPYDLYCFNGGWRTESFGCCRDFNLMTRDGTESYLGVLKAGKNKMSVNMQPDSIIILYCCDGSVTAGCNGSEYCLDSDRVLVFETGTAEENIQIHSDKPNNVIKATIKL